MHDLTGFQRDLLCVIARLETPDQKAIRSELAQWYGGEIDAEQLNPVLDVSVESGAVRRDGESDRFYALSRDGQRSLEVHHTWENNHLEKSTKAPQGVDAEELHRQKYGGRGE